MFHVLKCKSDVTHVLHRAVIHFQRKQKTPDSTLLQGEAVVQDYFCLHLGTVSTFAKQGGLKIKWPQTCKLAQIYYGPDPSRHQTRFVQSDPQTHGRPEDNYHQLRVDISISLSTLQVHSCTTHNNSYI